MRIEIETNKPLSQSHIANICTALHFHLSKVENAVPSGYVSSDNSIVISVKETTTPKAFWW